MKKKEVTRDAVIKRIKRRLARVRANIFVGCTDRGLLRWVMWPGVDEGIAVAVRGAPLTEPPPIPLADFARRIGALAANERIAA